jgi:CRISPR/Cas system CSM-associated protein Csm2 small subunit
MKEKNTSNLDIDLSSLDKEQLITLILYAHNRDITFNQAFVEILEKIIENNEKENG